MRGRFYIKFNVEFPDSGVLSLDQCRTLSNILPSKSGSKITEMELEECEETTLHDVDIEEEMRRQQQQQQQQEAYDEDHDQSAPRVQCAQQ